MSPAVIEKFAFRGEPQIVKRAKRERHDRQFLGSRPFSVRQLPKGTTQGVNADRLATELAKLGVDVDDEIEIDVDAVRPRTRAQCESDSRPCPFVGCRHHLALDITASGSLYVTRHLELETLPATCSLDVADSGEQTLEQVGVLLNLTRERVRQIQESGLAKVKALAHLEGVREDSLPFVPDRDHPPEI